MSGKRTLSQKNMGKGVDFVSRVNPKYHFPLNTVMMERALRIALGLPFYTKMGGKAAYGYTYDPEEDKYTPIAEVFKLLWEARQHLYTCSLRETAEWLNYKNEKIGTGQKITPMGLRNIMILRPPYEESQLSYKEREKMVEGLCQYNKKMREMQTET